MDNTNPGGVSVLMEVEELETAVMRTHLALQQFIRERKRDKEFDVDELPVGGVVSLSFSLLPEVRRQLVIIRDWLKTSKRRGGGGGGNSKRVQIKEESRIYYVEGEEDDSIGEDPLIRSGDDEGLFNPALRSEEDAEDGNISSNEDDYNPPSGPTTRKSYSLQDKLEIIRLLQEGKKQEEVASLKDMSRGTVSSIWKKRRFYLNASASVKDNSNTSNSKRLRKPKFEQVEEKVFQWCQQRKKIKAQVTGGMIKEKAKSVAKHLGDKGFTASGGWLEGFKRRYGIILTGLAGEKKKKKSQEDHDKTQPTTSTSSFSNIDSVQQYHYDNPQQVQYPFPPLNTVNTFILGSANLT